MTISGCLRRLYAIAFLAFVPSLPAQSPSPEISNPHTKENADQIAGILGINQLVDSVRRMRSESPCSARATVDELAMRQEILESVISASFQVDSALAEMDNERAHLAEISSLLQAKRDRVVNLANAANIVTGTGVGIAVNALQFSSTTANIGNGLGVGSGIASTVLSVIGVRLQHGPQRRVGRIPNMLAPLFGKQGSLNTNYSDAVMEYLHRVPPGEGEQAGSRLAQLMAEWKQAGRLGPSNDPQTEKQIARLTSSFEQKTKLSIDDISDRMAMLGDVTGRVALMKRDLADLMLSLGSEKKCTVPASQ